MAEYSADINLYTNNLLSSNLSNIILIFNDYYQIYLNGVDSDIIIDMYISKTLFFIFNKTIDYKLTNNLINLPNNSYNITFNNINLGYLTINIDQDLDKNQDNLIKTFLIYLSIFMYNSKYVKRPHLTECSIFVEVLNMINEGIIICDNNFVMLFLNNTSNIILKKIIEYDVYIKKSIFDVFSQIEDIIETNKIYKNKKINFKINKNNIDIYVNLNINTIFHNTNYYNIITLKPINESKKCDNIGFLSHELRNPLQSISFCNQLIQMKLNNQDNQLDNKKYLDIIDKSVYDMIKIINDILDIDRINSNQISLNINSVNINNIIQDIQFNFEKYNTNKNIDFKILLDNTLPQNIYTDSTRLKQIINNILSNSVKYSKSNTLNTITLSIYNDLSNNSINFSIKDTGIGIKQENFNELLDLKPTISHNKSNSNGIGLYLCNKLALLLGGNIKINSTYKEGSEFVFSHPIKLGYDNITIKKELENFNIFTKILIVDSNENITLLFKDIIQNLKFKYNINDEFTIDCCNSSNMICDMVKINDYDIIFMDIYISDINGITLVKLLRKQYFNKKIIGTSSDINDKFIDAKVNDLFDSIIIKPFDENDILDKLKY